MKIEQYYRDVLVPANVAVAAMQRAGMPVDIELAKRTREEWLTEIAQKEALVEAESAALGRPVKYSESHSLSPARVMDFITGLNDKARLVGGPDYFKGPNGKYSWTPTDRLKIGAQELAMHASLKVPNMKDGQPFEDDPFITAILQVKSLSKAITAHLEAWIEMAGAGDGAIHPDYMWALKTSRLAANNPPVHQIPERSEKRVASGVKACLVSRVNPARNRENWNPKIHGSCFRWDIAGAEAAIRAAMLTFLNKCTDPIAYDYIREGRDIHSKTASLVYGVEDGTYKKGTYQRDSVGKQVFFAKIFGAFPRAVQHTIWKEARIWVPDDEIRNICANFDSGYTGIAELYEKNRDELGFRMDSSGMSWVEDPYGKRRAIQIPQQAKQCYRGRGRGWDLGGLYEENPAVYKTLNNAFHIAANTPTQSCNGTDALWMLALCHHGEYVDLQVPPIWEADGIPFPEAKGWQMNGGDGPGGKPMQAWHTNAVHDSGWGDCAPGYLEPVSKLIWRRCRALPMDWRIKADVPFRVELKVGPDMDRMMDYNKAAKIFGLEPLPEK